MHHGVKPAETRRRPRAMSVARISTLELTSVRVITISFFSSVGVEHDGESECGGRSPGAGTSSLPFSCPAHSQCGSEALGV
ncbi:hypothetical protein L210DRAFT_3547038 [Boletus edulis BED1]|uniref:Uncharacterized protein n=1 Tax=Boletus edulis BED1 TaxID=1328754 RepID=A0AAD4GDN7_BOLED|nr:hypothetical protein L210DRAFT_3547038 [Boletus edulis BED1]